MQKEFERVVNMQIESLTEHLPSKPNVLTVHERSSASNRKPEGNTQNHHNHQNNVHDAIVHDLENEVPGTISTISHHISLANGHLGPNATKTAMNGHIPNGRPSLKNMLEDADSFTMDSHI